MAGWGLSSLLVQKGQAMKKTIKLTIENDWPILMALGTQIASEKEKMAFVLEHGRKDMAAVCEKYVREMERVVDVIEEALWEQ